MSTRARRGLPAILIATAVAGIAGYAVTWLVFRVVGPAEYSVFAVFWSATYLIVGALGGIQQEITRGTHGRGPDEAPSRPIARNFAVVAAIAVAIVVLAALPVWTLSVFPHDGFALVLPLSVATGAFVAVAVLGGTLYGLSLWSPVAWMITLDALLRLVGVGIVLLLSGETVALAWAVSLPFPVTVAVIWPIVRSRVVGRNRLDVAPRRLTWNIARTVVAAASTGVLISGFPAILKLTSPEESAQLLGVVILAVTLVRAPLIVTAMSLQGLLIVQLRRTSRGGRRLLVLIVLIVALGLAVSIVGWFAGPALFLLLFGQNAVVSAGVITALVASSTGLAILFVTGPALLVHHGHLAYSVGWVVAAVVTVGALLLPVPFLTRVLISLLAGPIAGLVLHAAGLVMVSRRDAGSPAEEVARVV